MANLLANPALWKRIYDSSQPPSTWSGASYAAAGGGSVYFHMNLMTAPVSGDVMAGVVTGGADSGAFLNYATPSGAVVFSQALSSTAQTFSFPAIPGRFVFTSSASNGNESGGYNQSITLTPIAAPAVSYNCACEDDYPRLTLPQMRRRLVVRLGYAAMPVPPPGVAELVDDFARQAQELLYRKYAVFRTERFFTWDMVAGERFYDLGANAEQTGLPPCTKALDPRKVTWVGVSQGDDQWQPIACGIDPSLYGTNISGIPQCYEIRQCIEVWPAPADATWKLRVKGHFGLLPFVAETDYTTIDAEAVFLLALANAKAHYGQPDAKNYIDQLSTYLGDLVSGSHQTRRYLPGARVLPNKPIPRLKDAS